MIEWESSHTLFISQTYLSSYSRCTTLLVVDEIGRRSTDIPDPSMIPQYKSCRKSADHCPLVRATSQPTRLSSLDPVDHC